MVNRWNRARTYLWRLMGGREAARETCPARASSSAGRHRESLEEQIAALEEEMLDLELGMATDRDPGGAAATLDVRRHLFRSRDLRYKVGLLRAELRRSFPEGVHATGEVEGASSGEDPPPGILAVAEQLFPGADPPGAFMESRAIDELEACLESPSHRLRLAAIRGLHGMGSPDCAAACLGCLADGDPEVRRGAAALLGSMGSRAAAPALAVLLRDEDVEVRVAAARALEALCSEQAVTMLIRALEDGDVAVRAAAKSALVRTLAMPLDIDVDQEPDILLRGVEALLGWWSRARTDGLPRSAPVCLVREAPLDV